MILLVDEDEEGGGTVADDGGGGGGATGGGPSIVFAVESLTVVVDLVGVALGVDVVERW